VAEKLDQVKVGDVVEVTGHRVGEAGRTGEILEVLGEASRPHFRVRWADGSESIFYPSTDATIRSLRRTKAKR
jgi:hypothetical protein